MNKLKKLLLEYVDMFNENFPTFMVMGASDEDLIKLLENSLKTGKKYEPEIIDGAIY